MKNEEFIRVISIYQAGLDKAIDCHAWNSVGQLLEEMKRVTAAFAPKAASDAIDKGLRIEQVVTDSVRFRVAKYPRKLKSVKPSK